MNMISHRIGRDDNKMEPNWVMGVSSSSSLFFGIRKINMSQFKTRQIWSILRLSVYIHANRQNQIIYLHTHT